MSIIVHVNNGIDKRMWFTYYVIMVPSLRSSNLSNHEVHGLTFITVVTLRRNNIPHYAFNKSNTLDDIIDIINFEIRTKGKIYMYLKT